MPHVPCLFGYASKSTTTLRTNVISVAMGTIFIYESTRLSRSAPSSLPYLSISLSLNVLLTLMIVVRLVLHARNTRTVLRVGGIGGLCKAIVTMLVESCALYAVTSLLYIGPLAANNTVANFFSFTLTQVQVRAIPRPQYSDRLTNRAGHRSAAHRSTSRQQERVDERHCRL